MMTVHNSGNTKATAVWPMDELENVGPFPSYVGSYDNLREVAKAATIDCLEKSGWASVEVTRVTLQGNSFHVSARRGK